MSNKKFDSLESSVNSNAFISASMDISCKSSITKVSTDLKDEIVNQIGSVHVVSFKRISQKELSVNIVSFKKISQKELDQMQFSSDKVFSRFDFSGLNFTNINISEARFENCKFDGAIMHSVSFPTLINCSLRGLLCNQFIANDSTRILKCDFSGARLGIIHNVNFIQCSFEKYLFLTTTD